MDAVADPGSSLDQSMMFEAVPTGGFISTPQRGQQYTYRRPHFPRCFRSSTRQYHSDGASGAAVVSVDGARIQSRFHVAGAPDVLVKAAVLGPNPEFFHP
ncbi:hypothetical protein [Streptomyces sp. NPDC003943]